MSWNIDGKAGGLLTGSSRKRGIFKRFADSEIGWDIFMGPIYNRHIMKTLPDVYESVVNKIHPSKKARILDVGSGPGDASVLLAERHPMMSVTGVDFSTTQVRSSNRLRDRRGVTNCCFIKGNAMDLPFEDMSFDFVLSIFSIKYWPDGKRGLREINRVLAPGGCALIAELNKDYTEEEFEFCMRGMKSVLAWYLSIHILERFARRVLLEKGISLDEADALAKSAGFSGVSTEKYEGDWPIFFMRLLK